MVSFFSFCSGAFGAPFFSPAAPAWSEWLQIGHYHTSLVTASGYRSLIDDDGFFFAPDGRDDPLEEFHHTVRAMEAPVPDNPDAHAACTFPLRRRFIQSLGVLSEKAPRPDCRLLQRYRRLNKAEGMSLVFTTSYFGNPASMFGHTFLRLDHPQRHHLLAPSIGYGAVNTHSPGLAYVWNGLTGGYDGMFSAQPYFRMVRQYGLLENRDLWEIRLHLTGGQVGRMTDHLWELAGKSADYFFLDENCSYMLLEILQVAAPEKDLTRVGKPWVLPLDTIGVLRREGLTGEARLRRARATRIHRRVMAMEEDELTATRAWLDALLDGRAPGPGPGSGPLELSAEYLQYLKEKEEVPKERFAFGYGHTLMARSKRPKLKTPPETKAVRTKRPPPDRGHGTMRALSLFRDSDGEGQSLALAARLVQQDLTDPEAGYEPGEELVLGEAEGDLSSPRRFRLRRFTVARVRALVPWDPLLRSWSWQSGLEWQRMPLGDSHLDLALVDAHAGRSWHSGGRITHVLGGAVVKYYGGDFGRTSPGLSLRMGWIGRIRPEWKVYSELDGRWFPATSFDGVRRVLAWHMVHTWQLKPGLALRGETLYRDRDGRGDRTWAVGTAFYF